MPAGNFCFSLRLFSGSKPFRLSNFAPSVNSGGGRLIFINNDIAVPYQFTYIDVMALRFLVVLGAYGSTDFIRDHQLLEQIARMLL